MAPGTAFRLPAQESDATLIFPVAIEINVAYIFHHATRIKQTMRKTRTAALSKLKD